MKTLSGLLFCLLAASAQLLAQEAHWLTDFQKATEQAKNEDKNILLDFTGSDWCAWCMKMDKDVLRTGEFKDYAAKNLVLMLVDFPQARRQPLEVAKQNERLRMQYAVNGFPTFVLLNKDGEELGRHEGYLNGGPGAFIAKLDSFKKR